MTIHTDRRWVPLAAMLALGACVDDPVAVERVPLGPPAAGAHAAVAPGFTPAMAAVGRMIFFDEDLSLNRNQSCAACHAPEWGFTGPITTINANGSVYEGSVAGRFGARKPPSSAYATVAPVFHWDADEGLYVGGNFWDGRATGLRLGNPAAEQAQGPFLNPVEQALRDEACVIHRIRASAYAGQYRAVFGDAIDAIALPADVESLCSAEGPRLALPDAVRAAVLAEYDHVAYAIAAFEDSPESNAFTSKYDAYLAGTAALTAQEAWGLELFEGKAMCSACHPSQGARALFTDFSYDNLGTPANPLNPVYASDPNFRDLGLGAFLKANRELAAGGFARENAKVKVPTLRNVDRRPYPTAPKAFTHNGVFKSLEEVVRFYNTRDVLPACRPDAPRTEWGATCWPRPEVRQNMNTSEMGDLGLTEAEVQALVAFMGTLSDGWM